MFAAQAQEICLDLLTQRIIPRANHPELAMNPALYDEVVRRLKDVGLRLVDRPTLPFLGIVTQTQPAADDTGMETLSRRALALLLFVWIKLVLPAVRENTFIPINNDAPSVTQRALLEGLPGRWTETELKRQVAVLKRLRFIEQLRGEEAYRAGPMIWITIDHDELSHHLTAEKAIHQALQRYLRSISKQSI